MWVPHILWSAAIAVPCGEADGSTGFAWPTRLRQGSNNTTVTTGSTKQKLPEGLIFLRPRGTLGDERSDGNDATTSRTKKQCV